MTSLRQIESNRRNALRSTGPKTESGKQRSSKNAIRHGLTAETVIEPLEDPEDYRAFEQAVTADYDAETEVERELVLRLASLLWRLRRTTLIETGLLQIESEVLLGQQMRPTETRSQTYTHSAASRFGQSTNMVRSLDSCSGDYSIHSDAALNEAKPELPVPEPRIDIAQCFLRLSNLDNSVFERLGRYEMALWRQIRQMLFTLEGMRWRPIVRARRRHPMWR